MSKLNKFGKCPECGKSWDGGDIPEKSRKHYAKPYKWSKLVGIEVRGEEDVISYWQCPFCKTTWDRWTGEIVKEDIS